MHLFALADRLGVDIDVIRHEWPLSKLREWLAYFELIAEQHPFTDTKNTSGYRVIRRGNTFVLE
ncbi:MAG TPA: hypothetical protein O0X43_03795 [Methanocorpusculum sp.]|nr:hypothetical protein [Methanocorpusculum sp.]